MTLFWHRNDLRISDNRGLAAAADIGDVVPAFVFDPDVLHYASPPRVAFMLEAIESLRESYRDRGSDIVTRIGDPAEEIRELADNYDASTIVWNKDYSGLAQERDQSVETVLSEAGYETESYHDRLFHEPGEITAEDGGPIEVYDEFWKQLRPLQGGPRYRTPNPSTFGAVSSDGVPTLQDLGFETPTAEIPPAGESVAQDKLDAFCNQGLFEYEDAVNEPGDGTVSRLSDHIRWGTLSVRQVYASTEAARDDAAFDTDHTAIDMFQRQLGWREYYYHVLFQEPNVVANGYKGSETGIDWRNDENEFEAWKSGETGYPLVDAGMRQLQQEAHMHNTVRVSVASFLTKYLHIDWRRGYKWFRERLVDHNPANDSGGWQWAASTGINVPGYVTFDPAEQAREYDPGATYIKKYVPELEGLDPETIHDWPELSENEQESHAPDYPCPIVDGAVRLEQARQMYQDLYPDELTA